MSSENPAVSFADPDEESSRVQLDGQSVGSDLLKGIGALYTFSPTHIAENLGLEKSTDELILEAFVNGKFSDIVGFLREYRKSKKLKQFSQSMHQDVGAVQSEHTGLQPSVEQIQTDLEDYNIDQYKLLRAIKKRKIVKDPVNSLLVSENYDLMYRAMRSSALKLKSAEVLNLLKLRLTDLLLTCLRCINHSTLSTHPWLVKFEVIAGVSRLFDDITCISDAIQIFSMIRPANVSSRHIKVIVGCVTRLLHPEQNQTPALALSTTPFSTLIILSDFLERIKDYDRHFTGILLHLSKELVTVLEGIVYQIDDIRPLRENFNIRPLGTYYAFEYLINNASKYRTVLNYPLTKELILQSWTKNIQLALSFDESSYVFKATERDRSPKKLWKIHKSELNQHSISMFQYQSWVNNCNVRHSIESASLLAFLCLLIYILFLYLSARRIYMKVADHSKNDISSAKDDMDSMTSLGDYAFLPYALLLGFQSLSKVIFKFKMNILNKVDPRFILDGVIFVTATMIWFRVFGSYESESTSKNLIYEYVWGVMSFTFSSRVFLSFAVDYSFGPILRMLFSTFVSTVRFLLIFFVVMTCFSITFYNFFYDSPGFNGLTQSMITLFTAALGTFDYYAFESRKELGMVMLTVWIVLATIFLLNILIAVLSSRYEQLTSQTDSDFVSLLFLYVQTTKFDKNFGGLVIFPMPFSCLLIPFVPLYLTSIDKAKLTVVLAKLSYVPMLCTAIVSFAAYNAIWSVYAYFKVGLMFSFDVMICKMQRAKNCLKWAVGGPPYLLYLSTVSFPPFLRFLFAEECFDLEPSFTQEDVDCVAKVFKDRLQSDLTSNQISIDEALHLCATKPTLRKDIAISLALAKSKMLKHILKTNRVAPEALLGEDDYRFHEAYKRIVKAVASYKTGGLDLTETIQVLQTVPIEQMKTYARYATEKALSSLHEAS